MGGWPGRKLYFPDKPATIEAHPEPSMATTLTGEPGVTLPVLHYVVSKEILPLKVFFLPIPVYIKWSWNYFMSANIFHTSKTYTPPKYIHLRNTYTFKRPHLTYTEHPNYSPSNQLYPKAKTQYLCTYCKVAFGIVTMPESGAGSSIHMEDSHSVVHREIGLVLSTDINK